jgi:WhiB family transcriptional regulator, redox-sensing transcriptional regulator
MVAEPDWAWRYEAKCAKNDVPTDLFYPPRDRRLYKGIADKAKAVCWGTDGQGECSVRRECLWYSLETQDTHGIWGGLSHRERSHLRKRYRKEHPPVSFKAWILKGPGGDAKKAKRSGAVDGDEEGTDSSDW